jgi:carbon starvation protein
MDSACRLQRYVTQELGAATGIKPLKNKHIATVFAIVIAGAIASMPMAGEKWELANLGKGGLILWPLFGATNQLLGGLAFLVILFWMWRRDLPIWFVAIPAVFMLILPAIAMISQLFIGDAAWITGENPNLLLSAIGITTLVLEAWILVEAAAAWPKAKGVLEQPA